MSIHSNSESRESTHSVHPRRLFCACEMNGWCLRGKTNNCIFYVLVRSCSLRSSHRVNAPAGRYDIWGLDGLQAFSKKLRQLTGRKRRGLRVPRRRAPCHICHTAFCSGDDASELLIVPQTAYVIPHFEEFIELVGNIIVAVIVHTAAAVHPMQKSVLRSASISKR